MRMGNAFDVYQPVQNPMLLYTTPCASLHQNWVQQSAM
jgi:hypothetical protein